MKKQVLNIFTVVALCAAVVSCKKAKEADTSEAEAVAVSENTTDKYTVNVEESRIYWKGFKPTGSHTGTIGIESGVLTMNSDAIESGTFLIDMASIAVTDIPVEDEGNAKLTGHLKSPDFFDVEAFPSSVFEVTGFEMKDGKAMLSGNLKMKDAKNNITIPVSVNDIGNNITLTSDTFTIDRSKWNIKYGSKSFFDDLGDKFINDDMELQIKITATKS